MKKIKSIEVKNSPFYADFRLEFSDKLNCIMGGRGTGKTTLLYFLKAALDKSSMDDSGASKLLRNNLGGGTITVEIESPDATVYNITKTIDDTPQPYILPSLDYIPLSKIFSEIECDFYEAGRIEEIGRSSKDRLELIDKKIKTEIADCLVSVKQIQIDLDSNAQDIKSFNRRLVQFDDVLAQYGSAEDDFENQKGQKPAGISEDENKSFEDADSKEKVRKQESRFFNRAIDTLKDFQNTVFEADLDLTEYSLNEIDDPQNYQNVEVMQEGFALMSETVRTIKSQLAAVLKYTSEQQSKFDSIFLNLIKTHDLQQAEFVLLKQKFELNREYINKYNALSKRVAEKSTLLKDKEDFVKRKNKLKEARFALVNKLNVLKQKIFKRRLEAVKQLNATFNKEVVITLTHAGIKDEFQEKLRNGLKGSGLQYNTLVPRIIECFAPDAFAQLIHTRNVETLKNITGIDDYRANAIIEALFESEIIYEIECLYCNDLPEFKLRIASDADNLEENYKNTDELSMGQRCTTVLPIIFAVSTNPLIIDQPEDNLDNRYISQSIHEIIREQKQNRQLIFITHNPNIPVLSDADKNIFLEYENRLSKIQHVGSVDEVKQDIISLLEGGAQAFEKRMEIYGYENNL